MSLDQSVETAGPRPKERETETERQREFPKEYHSKRSKSHQSKGDVSRRRIYKMAEHLTKETKAELIMNEGTDC